VTPRSFRGDLISRVAASADSAAVIDAATGTVFTWAQLDTLTRRIGGWFERNRFAAGDTLLSMLPNSVEALFVFFACMRHGIRCAPLPPSATAREIERLSRLVSPRGALALAGSETRIAEAAGGIAVHAIPLDLSFGWAGPDERDPPPASSRSGHLLIATSGSTGEPKVMVIDGDRLWSAACAFAGAHRFLGADSRFYDIMPMSYLGGLFNLGLIPLACGGSTVVSSTFSGSTILRFWHEVARHRVNVLWLVPTMLRALVQVTGPRWETVAASIKVTASFLGTAPVGLAEKETFERIFGIPLLENFALSETTFLTSETLDTRGRRTEGSVGPPLAWAEVRLVPVGESDGKGFNRIQVRTPFLFDGYLGSDGLRLPVDPDGWFDTGDLGHLDLGQLVLDGRVRDVIKKGGLLIHLPEVELVARQCPGVAEVAAVDIPHAFYGEDYALFAVFALDAPGNDAERTDRLRSYLNDALVNTKWPAQIACISEIPRTPSGKVSRPKLRELVAVTGRK